MQRLARRWGNLLSSGAVITEYQSTVFEADLSYSRRITYIEWRERPLREKIGERLASLFGSQF